MHSTVLNDIYFVLQEVEFYKKSMQNKITVNVTKKWNKSKI